MTMPKRSSIDVRKIAKQIAEETEGMSLGGKDPIAAALGRRGGKKGGPARAAALSAEKRHEIAAKAARIRWSKENA